MWTRLDSSFLGNSSSLSWKVKFSSDMHSTYRDITIVFNKKYVNQKFTVSAHLEVFFKDATLADEFKNKLKYLGFKEFQDFRLWDKKEFTLYTPECLDAIKLVDAFFPTHIQLETFEQCLNELYELLPRELNKLWSNVQSYNLESRQTNIANQIKNQITTKILKEATNENKISR